MKWHFLEFFRLSKIINIHNWDTEKQINHRIRTYNLRDTFTLWHLRKEQIYTAPIIDSKIIPTAKTDENIRQSQEHHPR